MLGVLLRAVLLPHIFNLHIAVLLSSPVLLDASSFTKYLEEEEEEDCCVVLNYKFLKKVTATMLIGIMTWTETGQKLTLLEINSYLSL